MPRSVEVPSAGRMIACPFRVTPRFVAWVVEEAKKHDRTPGAYLDEAFGGAKRGGWNHE